MLLVTYASGNAEYENKVGIRNKNWLLREVILFLALKKKNKLTLF